MSDLTARVKETAMGWGASFVGIAPRERFDGAPEFSAPERQLPEFKSVIAIGIAMGRGNLKSWFAKRTRRPIVIEGKVATADLDRIAARITRMLEGEGYETTFVSQNGSYNILKGEPDFSHKPAAMAAGLGRLGLSSCFVHNEYGASAHLGSVITSAELEPDPMVEDEKSPCNGCGICAKICPVQAMDPENLTPFLMGGKEYSHATVDKLKCAWGCSGFYGHEYEIAGKKVGTWAFNNFPMPDSPSDFISRFLEANRNRHSAELAEMDFTNGTEYCGNCLKICVGSKKDTAVMFKLYLNSGLAPVPSNPLDNIRLTALRDDKADSSAIDLTSNY